MISLVWSEFEEIFTSELLRNRKKLTIENLSIQGSEKLRMVVGLETMTVATSPMIPCSFTMATAAHHPSATIPFCSAQPTQLLSLSPSTSTTTPFATFVSSGHATHHPHSPTINPVALNILNPLIITPSSWKQS